MEKRTRPRVAVNVAATMQVLGESSDGNGEVFPIRIVDASDRGMRFQADVAISPGRAVKIEMGESMFLGETCYCAPAPEGSASAYNIGVMTEQCLTGLGGLQHLIRALEPEKTPKLERV